MIKETTTHNHEWQRIVYGTVKGVEFRVEINELDLVRGIVSTVRIDNFHAKTVNGTSIIKSNVPDEYKQHLAEINKMYSTFFLTESQLSGMEEVV